MKEKFVQLVYDSKQLISGKNKNNSWNGNDKYQQLNKAKNKSPQILSFNLIYYWHFV